MKQWLLYNCPHLQLSVKRRPLELTSIMDITWLPSTNFLEDFIYVANCLNIYTMEFFPAKKIWCIWSVMSRRFLKSGMLILSIALHTFGTPLVSNISKLLNNLMKFTPCKQSCFMWHCDIVTLSRCHSISCCDGLPHDNIIGSM